jgi:hypothetical protein
VRIPTGIHTECGSMQHNPCRRLTALADLLDAMQSIPADRDGGH